MTKAEIITLIKANPRAFMATIDGNRPRVRAMGTYDVDESGVYIQTWTNKDIHAQILKNPAVELCYNDYNTGVQVRITGKAEIIKDTAMLHKVVEKRPFTKATIDEKGWDVVALYRIRGQATTWTRDKNFEPKTCVDF